MFVLSFAVSPDFRFILFCTSRRTTKFAHILEEPRAAFLIDNRLEAGADFGGAIAVTCLGNTKEMFGQQREDLTKVFLAKNPSLKDFVEQETTVMCFMRVEKYKVDKFAQSREIVMT